MDNSFFPTLPSRSKTVTSAPALVATIADIIPDAPPPITAIFIYFTCCLRAIVGSTIEKASSNAKIAHITMLETVNIPTVKIEISVLSMAEPYEMKRISSLVEQIYKDEDVDSDIVQTIKTVSPARTFLEKAFLLCEEYQKKEPRTYRMSRHFYDLEKLSHTDYMDKALNDSNLYYDIVEHRKKFYHVGYVDYDKELPASITIVPSEELVPKYEVDYSDMRSSFIYGEALEFADLLKFLETLQERFRKVPPRATVD